ncbi:MAG: 16S rRNA (guanine(527)-N(7))-methyltransferase RsmG [Paracoccaceae bacterium]|nr:16S rRNA (guanine(527)-N(7))-methyltransferase RsmG [Paracoccaceae bacterium]
MSPAEAPAELAEEFDVSCETLERLTAHISLLRRWNPGLNLVSPASLPSVWQRHVADSLQLLPHAPDRIDRWLDLGAGAGFPGLPVAAVLAVRNPAAEVVLIESDHRKAAFLREAVRAMGLTANVLSGRIESIEPIPCDVVSARALAPLPKLCSLAYRIAAPMRSGRRPVFLFPKGKALDSELTAASATWHIQAERIASRTNTDAAILRIIELEPRK